MARSKVKSRSDHDIAHLHLTNVPTKYQLPTPYGSEIQPGQTFSQHPPAHPYTMGENNTPTALRGCGVKIDISAWYDLYNIYVSYCVALWCNFFI